MMITMFSSCESDNKCFW